MWALRSLPDGQVAESEFSRQCYLYDFINSILMSIAERMPRAFRLAALSPVLVIKKSAQRLH